MTTSRTTLLATEALVSATSGQGWLDRINNNFIISAWVDVKAKTANYTATVTDCFITVDPTGGAVTITLPQASTATGMVLYVQPLNVSNTVTLDGYSAETINGSATKTIGTANRRVQLICTGTLWLANYYDPL